MKTLQDSSHPVPKGVRTYARDTEWRQISSLLVSLHRVITGICMRYMVLGWGSLRDGQIEAVMSR
jgi:hypothetical protein